MNQLTLSYLNPFIFGLMFYIGLRECCWLMVLISEPLLVFKRDSSLRPNIYSPLEDVTILKHSFPSKDLTIPTFLTIYLRQISGISVVQFLSEQERKPKKLQQLILSPSHCIRQVSQSSAEF